MTEKYNRPSRDAWDSAALLGPKGQIPGNTPNTSTAGMETRAARYDHRHYIEELIGSTGGGGSGDEGKVRIDAADIVAGYLSTKLLAGTWLTSDVANLGEDETYTLSAVASSDPGSAASLLATDSSGHLRLDQVTIATQIVMEESTTIGQTAGPLLTFYDSANKLLIDGADVDIGDTLPNAGTGGTWSVSTTLTGDANSGRLLVWQGKLYCAFSNDVYVYDGVSWEVSLSNIGTYCHCIVVFNNQLYAFGRGSVGSTYRTSDGITWDNIGQNPNMNFISSATVHNGILWGCKPYGNIYSSPDGINWTLQYNNTTGYTYSWAITIFNGNLYYGGQGGVAVISRLVGATWSDVYSDASAGWISLYVWGGKIIAGDGNGYIHYSTTGNIGSWTKVLVASGGGRIWGLREFAGRLLATCADKVYSTTDGDNWTLYYDSAYITLYELCEYGGNLYTVYNAGVLKYYDPTIVPGVTLSVYGDTTYYGALRPNKSTGAIGNILLSGGASYSTWLPNGATTTILVGGGEGVPPVWTTATGSGAPVEQTSPVIITPSIYVADAATNTVTTVATLGHDTSGTAAAGFGAKLLWQLGSSTTAAQDAAAVTVSWTTATHASRTANVSIQTVDAAGSLTDRILIDVLGLQNLMANTVRVKDYTLTVPATGTAALGIGATNALAIWSGTNTVSASTITTDIHFVTGFVDRSKSSISLSTRTITIAPVGPATSFDIYSDGVKFTKSTGASCATEIANSVGLHFVYFDSTGTLQHSTDAWVINSSNIPVCTVFWNGSVGAISDERHGAGRNLTWHTWAHDTIGTRYETGLGQTYPTTSVDGKIQIESGTIFDEDMEVTISQQKVCRLWYETAAATWTWINGTDNAGNDRPYVWNAGTSRIQYPKSDSSYTLTDVDSNKFVVLWAYATTDKDRPIYVITAAKTTPYTNITAARSATAPSTAGLLAPEMKLIYRWIYSGDGEYQEGTDYRASSSLPAGGTQTVNALAVSFAATGTIAATNVQNAIAELDTEKEPALGVPAADGYLLSSTMAGARSWVAAGAGSGDISGTGVAGQVAEFVTNTKTIQAAKIIGPSTNILTFTASAASTLGLVITAGKTLTLTSTDDFNLTVPATGTAALGTGTNTQLAYWSGTNSLTSSANLTLVPASTGLTIQAANSMLATLGSDILTNGNFATNDLTGWTAAAGWSAATGKAVHTAGIADVTALVQSVALTNTLTYEISVTTSGITAGTLTLTFGSLVGSYAITTNVTTRRTFKATSTASFDLTFTPTATFNGAVDDVTCKLVTANATPLQSWLDSAGSMFAQVRGTAALFNFGIGANTHQFVTVGASNCAYGSNSQYSLSTGSNNSAYGYGSQYSLSTGSNNSAYGYGSQYYLSTGSNNSAYGLGSQYSLSTGSNNSAYGLGSLYYLTDGTLNTAVGIYSGYNPTNNIAQYQIVSDTSMTLIGYGATKDNAATITNGTAIGALAQCTKSNQVVLGNTSVTETILRSKVGIGTTAPITALDVRSSVFVATSDYVSASAGSGFQIYLGAASGNTYSVLQPFIAGATAMGDMVLCSGGGNVGIGTATFGTSASKVLALFTGTAPSTSPPDTVQLFSVDLSAGNATLGIRTETAVATETVTSDRTLSVKINGTTYKICLKV